MVLLNKEKLPLFDSYHCCAVEDFSPETSETFWPFANKRPAVGLRVTKWPFLFCGIIIKINLLTP